MNEKRVQPIAVITALALLMLVVVSLPLLPQPTLAADWDVGIKHLITTRMVYEGGWGKAGETTNTFTVGDEVLILCQYEYVKVGDKNKFKPWNVELFVSNVLQETYSVMSYEEPHKAPWAIYKATYPGSRYIKCSLGMLWDINSKNDTAEIMITVKPGPPLTAAEIPIPLPDTPSAGQKITLTPNLYFLMGAGSPKTPVRGYTDFNFYSVYTSKYYVQKWNVDIVRMGGVGERGVTSSTVGTFEKEVNHIYGVGFPLTREWLDAHGAGAGQYAARFYFSETANGVTTKGRSAVVKFELTEPLKAGSGPPGGAMIKPGQPKLSKTPDNTMGSSSGSGEPVPQLPTPSVTRKVTVHPTLTNVIPYLLSPGKGYTLLLQGQALTQQMVLDLGPGITIIDGSLKIGGPEGMASLMVKVSPDAATGARTVKLASAPGQPWKIQSAKLAVFVEPTPRDQGPIKATPLR